MINIYIFDEYQRSQKNGIGTYLQELIYCLKSLKYNINLIIFNAETDEFKIVFDKKIKKLIFPPLPGHFVYYVSVIDKILRLHIEDNFENIFFINHTPCDELIESLKTHFPLSKVIFTIHDFWWTMPLMGNLKEYKKHILYHARNTERKFSADTIIKIHNKETKVYKLADRIVCLSNNTFSILQNFHKINTEKLRIIPNGLRDIKYKFNKKTKELVKNELFLNNSDIILLYVGRLSKQKGIFDLLAAMQTILISHPNVKLAIIGKVDESSINTILKKSFQFSASIILTGTLEKKDIYKWLKIADIGIIPSYYEQCSYVSIEMMMHCLPIVTSNGLGLNDIFIDGINAKVAKLNLKTKNKEYQYNLANKIINLIEHPKLCIKLSENARRSYKAYFTIKQMKLNYKQLIDGLYE